MYPVAHFRDGDSEEIYRFMQAHPFATLCGADATGKPVATQVPLMIDKLEERSIILTGHIMRNTTHHKAFATNSQVLCLFTGAHAYVSATWYSNEQQASTWNYSSVQAHGLIEFLPEEELINILQQTSLHFESGNESSPTVLHNLPEAYSTPLLKAIVGFRVSIKSIDHVFKLSQNRDEQSFQNIISHLQAGADQARSVADAMRGRKAKLFTK